MSSVFHRGKASLRRSADSAAIFVHAGAGYHSVQNENIHLQACNDAAMAAMALLRAGGSAVDAVELAIKVLEDREITNAGYGSNLSIDGTVEGDAVIVDHLGRSGACGAVSNIKNPISLARKVLFMSTQELSLRRVPPNLLVGGGATDFAHDHNLPIVPNDMLVSPSARERWNRWRADLRATDRAEKHSRHALELRDRNAGTASSDPSPVYDELPSAEARPAEARPVEGRPERNKATRAAVWNEGQPTTPPSSGPSSPPLSRPQSEVANSSAQSRHSSFASLSTRSSGPDTPMTDEDIMMQDGSQTEGVDRASRRRDTTLRPTGRRLHVQDAARDSEEGLSDTSMDWTGTDDVDVAAIEREYEGVTWHDGLSVSDQDSSCSDDTLRLPSLSPSLSPETQTEHDEGHAAWNPIDQSANEEHRPAEDPSLHWQAPDLNDDIITDTVGAIAIDNQGNIACGASSGGIGMKFRGRTGPAALVGVGAAVVPIDQDDKSKTCTAAVTSGTGEHMATTLAASVCAERLHNNQKKRRGGGMESVSDDEAVRAMVEEEFMRHPSVRYSHSAGAIGVLSVKKTPQGAWLYFAHNTDSFALASMHTDDPKPACTMSRSHGNGSVAAGGRAIRFKRKW